MAAFRSANGGHCHSMAVGSLIVAAITAAAGGCTKADSPAAKSPALPSAPSITPVSGAPASATKPVFPDLPAPRTIVPGVEFYDMQITGTGPGLPMELMLYLPAGRHDVKSLPCVFIAPAGAGPWGMAIGDGDRPEHIPYARAGFAVVVYEVSGGLAQPKAAKHTYADLIGPIKKFMRVDGGLVNAKTAIEFALQKVPEVDPDHIYACGHSSAAGQALDLAAGDSRIRACCAYAPLHRP